MPKHIHPLQRKRQRRKEEKMEQKLHRLIELRKLQHTQQTEIDQLVAELSNIIKPTKKRTKKEPVKEVGAKPKIPTATL
jgi:hypothetical protein